MAKKKTTITVKLIQDFANKKTGDFLELGKEIAVSVVKRGFAVYHNEEEVTEKEKPVRVPEKEETKFKTSKSKKK